MPLIANVQPNGNAPQGLQTGDFVRTAGGMYQIVAPGTPGATFNNESGYWSQKSGLSIPEQIDEYNNLSVLNARDNTARSQVMAQNQMNFQTEANAKAMAFSAEQAEKNRAWQERMSNTAHQREVLDLVRAGLNPILSANSGASTPSGSAAAGVTSSGSLGQVDLSANSIIGGLLSALIAQQTSLGVADINRQTALETTSLNNTAAQIIAGISARANMFSALQSASAVRYSSDQSAAASRYAQDMSYKIANDFPSNAWQAAGTVSNSLSGIMDEVVRGSQSTYNEIKRGSSSGKSVGSLAEMLQDLSDRFVSLINYK